MSCFSFVTFLAQINNFIVSFLFCTRIIILYIIIIVSCCAVQCVTLYYIYIVTYVST